MVKDHWTQLSKITMNSYPQEMRKKKTTMMKMKRRRNMTVRVNSSSSRQHRTKHSKKK
jgi:hypothetical protein